MKKILLTISSAIALSGAINAQTFFSPTSATASHTAPTSFPFTVTETINNTGLSSSSVTLSNIGSISHIVGTGLPPGGGVWRGQNALPYTLTYNLGQQFNISHVGLWQGLTGSGNVGNFTLDFFSGANATGTMIGSQFSGTLADTLNGQAFATDYHGVESIRMTINSVGNNHSYAHFGEFKVAGSVTPEPSSTALLGLGALGLIARRKR